MKITVLASTVEEQDIEEVKALVKSGNTDEAINKINEIQDLTSKISLAGKTAGVCYMREDYLSDTIQNKELSIKRAKMTASRGHHSIYDHSNITLLMEGIPKVVAMMLNNTQYYTTSEKSARYTLMEPQNKLEKELYNKWIEKFNLVINGLYPEMDKVTVNKLAQENARYLISVFTPTVMVYTTSHRQLSYIIDWAEKLSEQLEKTGLTSSFYKELVKAMLEFKDCLVGIMGEQPIKDNKNREFNLFTKLEASDKEIISDVYKMRYRASFAELAQAQRHRTIVYRAYLDTEEKDNFFYIPKCIYQTDLQEEWLSDAESIRGNFPQGLMLDIEERGLIETFLLKSKERICGRAQLEIADITAQQMSKFIGVKEELSILNKELLERHIKKDQVIAKCLMDGFKCKEVCSWGSKGAIDRLI